MKKKIDHLNSPGCIKEIEFILKNCNTKNSKSNGFTNKVYQTFKEEITCQEEEGAFTGVAMSFELRLAKKSWITTFLGSSRTTCQHPYPRHPGFISLPLYFCTPPYPHQFAFLGSQAHGLAGSTRQ